MKDQLAIASARAVDVLPDAARGFPPSVNGVETLDVLRRRWRLITCLVAASGALTYLLCQALTPLYAAKTAVMIDTRGPSPAASRTNQIAMPPSEETLRKNEIAVIRSRSLAEAVVTRLSLDQDPEFNPSVRSTPAPRDLLAQMHSVLTSLRSMLSGPPEGKTFGSPGEEARDKAVETLLERLNTTSTDASRVIEIRILSEDPERAARISNTIADQYISAKIEQQIAGPQSVAQSLERNIEALNQKIRDSERNIEEKRAERGLLSNANARVAVEQLAELNKQLAAATRERVAAEARLRELQSPNGSSGAASASSVLGSPLIQRLQAEATLLVARIGHMSTSYGESYPKIAEARAELKELHAQIDAEIAKVVNSYRNALVVAKANETSLGREVELLKAQLAVADMAAVDVRVLERETEADRNLLTQLTTRLNDTTAQIKLQGPEAWIISRATVPRFPSFPPKLAMVAAAILFSATGGTIMAILLERRDRSIRSIAQIRQLTSARVLGAIPMVKGARKPRRSPQLQVLNSRRSLFAENLRAVWYQIDRVRTVPAKVLLITSSVSGEGKSSIATCLGCMMALAGRRIVVVDADLRNPSVHRALGMEKSPGLAELLEGKAELDQVLQFNSTSGVGVIAAGVSLASPAELLQSPKLSLIFRALAANFDTVIVDSPPTLAAHDTSILAQQADTTIMVVRWRETKITTLLSALQRMSDLAIPLTGIVLSMVDSKKYRREGYHDSELFSRDFRRYYADQ